MYVPGIIPSWRMLSRCWLLADGAAEFRLELVNSQLLDGCAIGASLRGREKNKDSRVRTPGRQRYGASLLDYSLVFQFPSLRLNICLSTYIHVVHPVALWNLPCFLQIVAGVPRETNFLVFF